MIYSYYVVQDQNLFVDLLVGHTFTEELLIFIIKTSQQLLISHLPNEINDGVVSNRFSVNVIQECIDLQLKIENIRCPDLSQSQIQTLFELMQHYESHFCFNLMELGRTNSIEMKIELICRIYHDDIGHFGVEKTY